MSISLYTQVICKQTTLVIEFAVPTSSTAANSCLDLHTRLVTLRVHTAQSYNYIVVDKIQALDAIELVRTLTTVSVYEADLHYRSTIDLQVYRRASVGAQHISQT